MKQKQQPAAPSEADRLKSLLDEAQRKSAAATGELARVRAGIADIARQRAEDDGARRVALLRLEDDAFEREAAAEQAAMMAKQHERAAAIRHRQAEGAECWRALDARCADLAERLLPAYQAEAATIAALVTLSVELQKKIKAADRRITSRSAPRIAVPQLLAGDAFLGEALLPRLTGNGSKGHLLRPGQGAAALDAVTLSDDLRATLALFDGVSDFDTLQHRVRAAADTIAHAYAAAARNIVDIMRSDYAMRREVKSAETMLRQAPGMNYAAPPSPSRHMGGGAMGALCAAVGLPAAAPKGLAHWRPTWAESMLEKAQEDRQPPFRSAAVMIDSSVNWYEEETRRA